MSMLKKEYDVIVVGGGINGLACAAYLQKSGLNVAVFERSMEAGKGCCTEEVMHPGVKVSLCANLIVTHWYPAYDDLELEKFGLEMLTPGEWGFFHPFKDKSAVLFHNWDAKKQYEAWKKINEKDAETFRKIVNVFGPFFAQNWPPVAPSTETVEGLIKDDQLGKLLSSVVPQLPSNAIELSAMEVADAVYEDERIKVAILSLGITAGWHPWHKTITSYLPLLLPVKTLITSLSWTCKGGSHALTHALVRCLAHYGGKIFTACPVEKIIVENGEAKGIVLSKFAAYPEAEIRAKKAVVSDLSCHLTFLDLIDQTHLPDWVIQGAKAYDYNDVILFDVHWVLNEMPDWSGYPPEVSRAYALNYGIEKIADIERFKQDIKNNRIPDPPFVAGLTVQGFCMADPTQAPPGQYVVMSWANVPYNLSEYGGGPEKWDDLREVYGDKIEDLFSQYMKNLKKAKINRFCNSPLDYYRKNPSMKMGSAIGGANTPSQHGAHRPFAGCGAPRTPIGKLYISNSIYPQGTTALDTGYIAADVVAQDLGVRNQNWWVAKPVEPGLKVLRRMGVQPRWTVD